MFRKPMIAACSGLAAATLLLGTAVSAPAAAAGDERPSRVVLRDGTGDVWKVNMRTSEWTLVGDEPAADVKRAVVSHRHNAVVMRARYENLRRIGKQQYWAGITTRHGGFFVEVVSRRGSRAGRHTMYGEASGAELACRGLSHDIDYGADVVRMRVPRSCLDRPRWVRVNVGNILVTGRKPHRTFYADNAHNARPYANVGTRRLYRR